MKFSRFNNTYVWIKDCWKPQQTNRHQHNIKGAEELAEKGAHHHTAHSSDPEEEKRVRHPKIRERSGEELVAQTLGILETIISEEGRAARTLVGDKRGKRRRTQSRGAKSSPSLLFSLSLTPLTFFF